MLVNGAMVLPDPSGALFWPKEQTLVVADMHLEKAATLARRGAGFLPPYDTRETLRLLEGLMRRHAPRRLVALGDAFHDAKAAHGLAEGDAARLRKLTAATDWIWITGNHDPVAPLHLGGRAEEVAQIGPLIFRHDPQPVSGLRGADGEVARAPPPQGGRDGARAAPEPTLFRDGHPPPGVTGFRRFHRRIGCVRPGNQRVVPSGLHCLPDRARQGPQFSRGAAGKGQKGSAARRLTLFQFGPKGLRHRSVRRRIADFVGHTAWGRGVFHVDQHGAAILLCPPRPGRYPFHGRAGAGGDLPHDRHLFLGHAR